MLIVIIGQTFSLFLSPPSSPSSSPPPSPLYSSLSSPSSSSSSSSPSSSLSQHVHTFPYADPAPIFPFPALCTGIPIRWWRGLTRLRSSSLTSPRPTTTCWWVNGVCIMCAWFDVCVRSCGCCTGHVQGLYDQQQQPVGELMKCSVCV